MTSISSVPAVSADFEVLLMMYRAFETLGISDITIKVNHRGIFSRFLTSLGIETHSVEIMRAIDKIGKIGPDAVGELLRETLDPAVAEQILRYIQPKEDFLATLDMLVDLAGGEGEDTDRMRQLYEGFRELGIEKKFFFDSSIMRGLDYYTGLVYETFFNELPGIGSVCSGGRYDNLASLYTKTELPGVGSSIGLDRLVAALTELGQVGEHNSPADIAVFCLDEKLTGYYHGLAEFFRGEGFRCDVFYEKKKLGQQFKLAEKKGIPFALICGEDERRSNTVSLKDLVHRTTLDSRSPEEAVESIRSILHGSKEKN